MEQHRSFPWGVLLIVSLAVFILVIDTTIMEVSTLRLTRNSRNRSVWCYPGI
jgi:hypothetical protein